jgi:diaminohydroxyphosphoribosylaminopyrimidine deaminase/5-amino-6-(5-phosphoribosylamino)uracil reductase
MTTRRPATDASSAADRRFMREALRRAARARGRTAPNPLVGALVVRGGERVAAGHHRRLGAPHAEAVAIARSGRRTRGATLYCTLEPCAHSGLTPPCIDVVLEAGFRRVVLGTRDPDPRTAGSSIARLRRAGCAVTLGVESEACRELNRGFFSRVERGRPFTTLKLAATLDGRIATASGESRWITGAESRAWVHRLRDRVDAIAVGSGTVRADDPALTARRGGRVLHRPTRVVIDSKLATPPGARLLRAADRGTAWIVTTRDSPARRAARLERAGARIVRVGAKGSRVDLRAAWRRLGALGVNDLLVEGGGLLAAALLGVGLVDRLCLLLAPRLIGSDGRPVLGPLGLGRLADAPGLRGAKLRRLGPDLLLVADL